MLLDVVKTGSVAKIRRERLLPLRGEVLVNDGQEVHPEDLVAQASLPGKFYLVDIARGLDVDPRDAEKFLVREPGEYLLEDDVIAQVWGAFHRLVRAPVSGRFAAFHQGHALLEIERASIQVQAGIIGVVEAVIPEYGAIIATNGLLVQGVWGNGRIGSGGLNVVEAAWSAPLDASMLKNAEQGQVLAVGQCSGADTLAPLGELELAGLIAGSLAPDLIPAAMALSIPIIVLQGFGPLPTDKSLFELLNPLAGEVVCLHAAPTNRLTGERPEVIIPQPGEAVAEDPGLRGELRLGQRVRLCSGKANGQTGKVLAFVDETPLFESGLQLSAVVVALDDGERITTPQQNLVILG